MKAYDATCGRLEQETPSPPGTPQAEVDRKLSSRYRGVCWNKKNKRWQAAINRAGRYIYLGSFTSQEDAARAFDKAAVKLRGPQAKINFGFGDYGPEMAWFNQMSARGDFTELVIGQPKLLREETAPPPVSSMTPATLFTGSSSYYPPSVCTMYAPYGPIHEMTPPMFMPTLNGRVITPQQGPVPVGGSSVTTLKESPMYFNGTVHPDKPVIQPYPFIGTGTDMLSPGYNQFSNVCANQLPLSDPSVKPDTVAVQSHGSEEPLLPIVNMPEGAELKHVYKTNSNAFAVGFVRKESKETEVLLYDGRAMHEVGSFSTSDDAEQTCKSLLRILGTYKNGGGDPVQTSEVNVETIQMPPAAKSPVIQDNINVPYLDRPRGVSPFSVPVGQRPFDSASSKRDSCDSDNTCMKYHPHEHTYYGIDLDEANNFNANGCERQYRKIATNVATEDGTDTKSQDCITSIDPLLSVSCIGTIRPQQTPPTDTKCEKSTKLFNSLSLISGSLKNIVAVFNQSGNFSIIRREDTEEDVPEVPSQPLASSHANDEVLQVETPRLHNPSRCQYNFAQASSFTTEEQLQLTRDAALLNRKRNCAGEMGCEHFKKQRPAEKTDF